MLSPTTIVNSVFSLTVPTNQWIAWLLLWCLVDRRNQQRVAWLLAWPSWSREWCVPPPDWYMYCALFTLQHAASQQPSSCTPLHYADLSLLPNCWLMEQVHEKGLYILSITKSASAHKPLFCARHIWCTDTSKRLICASVKGKDSKRLIPLRTRSI